MAGADQVVCPFFGVVYERLDSLIYNVQINKLGPLVKEELRKLFKTFLKIKEVLDDAEEKQFNEKDVRVRVWLQELNDAAYEADDIFDEVEYEALQQAEGTSSSSNKKRMQRKQRKIIQKLIQIFDKLAEECSGLELQKGKEKSLSVSPDRITDPLLTEPKVYGRDEAREELVKQLLGSAYLTLQKFRTPISYKHPTTNPKRVLNSANSSSNGRDNISVFPIQGMGGLGKTTLAKMVYNDERVKKHFEFRSWVCISTDFDTRRTMKEIVASLPRSTNATEKLELQKHFHEELHDKRFLVVLDDVWDVTQDGWNEIKAFFSAGGQGSSIIVTTRLPTVSSVTSALPPYCPNNLSKEDCWALFKQYAFGTGNEERPALVKIGKKIVKKCQGLPLAAKALGGLLRFKNDETEWRSIKDSAIWNFKNNILPALRLSYYHLSFPLKRCFVYCSIFPKDLKIGKEQLIELWMANGLVQPRAEMDLVDAANAIFNELLWRSFFQDIEKDEDGNIISCKMHDLVHDLASSIAGDEYFLEDVESLRSPTEETRHASIQQKEYGVSPSSTLELMQRSSRHLRSLIQFRGNYIMTCVPEFIFSDFILLRALDLSSCYIKVVPDSIGEMKHLRYLNLSHNPAITSLPKSICLLRNMQTLNLGWCPKLASLPAQIEKIRCLINLVIERCDGLTSMPVGIGQLPCLRTLSMFVVGKESGSGVDGLQNLNNLIGDLGIYGLDAVETLMEAKEANLKNKKNIHSLKLCWAWGWVLGWALSNFFYSLQPRHQNVIEGLQPHSNLRKLEVVGYRGLTLSPSWLTESSLLPNLVHLSLSQCTCKHLGSLRKLPRLKILELSYFCSLKFIEDDASAAGGGGFPSLERLSLRWMGNLEGWSSSSSRWSWSQASAEEGLSLEEEPMRNLEGSSSQAAAVAVFRCLKNKSGKKLERCPKLKRGGGRLSLEEEPMRNLEGSSSSQAPTPAVAVAAFPCLKSVTLFECPKLKGVPLAWSPVEDVEIDGRSCNWMVLGSLRDLPSLPSLIIYGFQELEYFPSGTLTNLTALHKLVILDFPRLRALPVELYSLATLTELSISNCPNLVSLAAEEREGGLKNLSSLKTLVIHDCEALKRLPELGKASLVSLRIFNCPEMEFSKEDFEHLVVLEELLLAGLPKLTCFPEGIKHSAATLRILTLLPCSHYDADDLPDWIGSTLTSLEYLAIQAPKNWKVIPQWMKQLDALTDLIIYDCDEELVEQWKTSDMVSHIPVVEVYSFDDDEYSSDDDEDY